MGWISYHRPAGQTDAQHFRAKFDTGTRFVETATERGAFFAAVEYPWLPGERWAFIALIERRPALWDNFAYKDMDETVGPNVLAPRRILEALTPTESAHAIKWRAASWVRVAQIERVARAGAGATVRLSHPLNYGLKRQVQEFTLTYRYNGRGRRTSVACAHVDGVTYRLPQDWETIVDTITPANVDA